MTSNQFFFDRLIASIEKTINRSVREKSLHTGDGSFLLYFAKFSYCQKNDINTSVNLVIQRILNFLSKTLSILNELTCYTIGLERWLKIFFIVLLLWSILCRSIFANFNPGCRLVAKLPTIARCRTSITDKMDVAKFIVYIVIFAPFFSQGYSFMFI